MSKVKSEEKGSRASALIPVSVNFTTDGISGMSIGQGFTIPDKFLPYTYNERNVVSNSVKKVGFVILGAQHSFESNQWNTSIRANMIFLKDADDFNSSVANQYSAVNKFKGASAESQATFNSGVKIGKYENIRFFPSVDTTKIKDPVLRDVNEAAKAASVIVTIGFGVEGHTSGRHVTGNAVDIDYVNGKVVSKANQALVETFTDQLTKLGYSKNNEIPYQKAFLTFGFKDHDNHVHVSNKEG